MSQQDIEQDSAVEEVSAPVESPADEESPEAPAAPTSEADEAPAEAGDEVAEASAEADVEVDEPVPADPVAEAEVADEPVDELPEADAEAPVAEAGADEESAEVTVGDAEDDAEDAAEDAAEEAAEDEDVEDPLEAFRRELWAKPGEWYVVHTYYGMENRVRQNLENRIVSLNMEDYIHEIVVPTEEVAEIKNGQRKMVKRTVLPGYVLVRMDLTDESWAAVRHTPVGHRFRRPGPPAGAAEHVRGREHARPDRRRALPRRRPAAARRVVAPRPPRRSRSRWPTSTRPTP